MISTDPRAVLEAVVARYAALASYADRGAVHRRLREGAPLLSLPFTTRFKKPAWFRFEFSAPHPYPPLSHIVTRHVVGFDGRGAYRLTQRTGRALQIDAPPDLARAIVRATGISAGAVHRIARLLLPEVPGVSLLDLTDVRFNADTAIGAVACHAIAARYPGGGALELWIEKHTRLVRRVLEVGPELDSSEMREDIRVDEPLSDEAFAA